MLRRGRARLQAGVARRSRSRGASAPRAPGPEISPAAWGQIHQALDGLNQRMQKLEDGLRELIATTIPVLQQVERTATVHPVAPGAGEGLSVDQLANVLRAIVGEDAENRRRLWRAREDPAYERAFTDPEPLVSVTVATRGRIPELTERSLPSILGQSHRKLEVVVVGDAAPPEVEAAVLSFADPRVTYRNLTQRLVITGDESRHSLVGATMARNEAARMASGRWLVAFDDDVLAPEAVQTLLAAAQERRVEVAYGKTREVRSGHEDTIMGDFPPGPGAFSWASAIYHGSLSFFERELVATEFGIPGDWYVLDRMLRAGVRFGMVGETLATYYPSRAEPPAGHSQAGWRTEGEGDGTRSPRRPPGDD